MGKRSEDNQTCVPEWCNGKIVVENSLCITLVYEKKLPIILILFHNKHTF